MNELLCTLFLAAIDQSYRKHLDNGMIGRTIQDFWTLFNTFLDKYGRITLMDLENNLQRMKKDWYPSTPIEDMFGKIGNAHEYSIFAKNKYTNASLVNSGEIVILKTGQFPTQYGEWRKIPTVRRKWI